VNYRGIGFWPISICLIIAKNFIPANDSANVYPDIQLMRLLGHEKFFTQWFTCTISLPKTTRKQSKTCRDTDLSTHIDVWRICKSLQIQDQFSGGNLKPSWTILDYTIPFLFSNFPTSSNCTEFITIPRYSSNFAQDAFVIMLGPTFQLSLASFGDTTERTKQNRFMTVWPRMPKKDWWPFLVDIFIAS
jgi:hypothetical protein